MQYRTNVKNGEKLSVLGFGCMRFPRLKTGKIDMVKTKQLVDEAIELGVNYFDTAYIYRGCEEALGIALEGKRAKVNIATKLPLNMVKAYEDFDKIFNEQLLLLKTDYIDYYLMHMLSSMKTWNFLKSIGVEKWIAEKKASGQIRNIGFSFHGSKSEFRELIDNYNWEFVLVQYNYLDEHVQATREGIEYCEAKGIPAFIMEPLRGGYLANKLPKKAKQLLLRQNKNAVELALGWLLNQTCVNVVLSGMNQREHLLENVNTAKKVTAGSFSKQDNEIVQDIKAEINKKMVVPCTGCNYCMPCPFGVNIPACFASRNDFQNGKKMGWQQYILTCAILTDTPAKASLCKGCGKCEKHCPQNIPIRNALKEVKRKMEPFWFKLAIPCVKIFLKPKKKKHVKQQKKLTK